MVHRFDREQLFLQPADVRLDVMYELVLGTAWPDQQPFVRAAQGVDDMIEIVAIELLMPGADDTGLVVNLAERAVGFDALSLYVLGIEAKHARFLRIHPDDGVTVRHAKIPGKYCDNAPCLALAAAALIHVKGQLAGY